MSTFFINNGTDWRIAIADSQTATPSYTTYISAKSYLKEMRGSPSLTGLMKQAMCQKVDEISRPGTKSARVDHIIIK